MKNQECQRISFGGSKASAVSVASVVSAASAANPSTFSALLKNDVEVNETDFLFISLESTLETLILFQNYMKNIYSAFEKYMPKDAKIPDDNPFNVLMVDSCSAAGGVISTLISRGVSVLNEIDFFFEHVEVYQLSNKREDASCLCVFKNETRLLDKIESCERKAKTDSRVDDEDSHAQQLAGQSFIGVDLFKWRCVVNTLYYSLLKIESLIDSVYGEGHNENKDAPRIDSFDPLLPLMVNVSSTCLLMGKNKEIAEAILRRLQSRQSR